MANYGECKYGKNCCFYHTSEERRNLLDPLPDIPEGGYLPPMP